MRAPTLAAPAGPSETHAARLSGPARIAILFFSASLVVFVSSGFARGNYDVDDIWRVGIPMMIVDGLIAFQLVFLLHRTEGMPKAVRLLILGLGVLAVAALQSLWDTQLRIWAGTAIRDYGSVHAAIVRATTLNIYHSALFTALIAYDSAYRKLRENQRQIERLRSSERDAHMLALRFQLNPHFLFNTLNAISSLVIVRRPQEAEEMIDRLASFLRASLTADPVGLVSVDDEFEMLGSYLDIESVRFGDRLAAELDLPPELAEACIPPFLLQPLVENAIKYAVAPSRRTVQVLISAAEEAGELVLRVVDDGDGCGVGDVPGTGVGLKNVRERLRLRYGPAATLDLAIDETGCRAEVRLPLEREGGLEPRAELEPA